MIRSLRRPAVAALLVGAATIGAVALRPPIGDARPLEQVDDAGGPVTTEPAPEGNVETAHHRDPVAGLVAPRPVPVEGVVATAEDNTVLVLYRAGEDACEGLHGVDVDERAGSVVLAVSVGSVPDAASCEGPGALYATTVVLDAPLDERVVVDAALATATDEPAIADEPAIPDDPDVAPEPRPETAPGSVEEVAWDFVEAWRSGDAAALARAGTAGAVDDALEAAAPAGAKVGWFHSRCEPSGSRTYCTWVRPGERLQLVVGAGPIVEELSVAILEPAGTARQLFFSWVAGAPDAVAALATGEAAAQAAALADETIWAWQYRNCEGSSATVTCTWRTTTRELTIAVEPADGHHVVTAVAVTGR
ncbi:MAG: hypothetical protein S0880_05010 [Actinomycetota bacterium]|nr:hypothetical protein [Actinomycetota bacterium]